MGKINNNRYFQKLFQLFILIVIGFLNIFFINCSEFKSTNIENSRSINSQNTNNESTTQFDPSLDTPPFVNNPTIPVIVDSPTSPMVPIVPSTPTPFEPPPISSPVMPTSPISEIPIVYNKINFTESAENFPNPERGFYDRVDLNTLTESSLLQLRDSGNNIYPYPIRLIYSQVDISKFRSTDFTSDFLSNFESKLQIVRSTSVKLVLRFVYDDSESGLDASANQIQKHLEQLKPILAQYNDTIAFFQAGFIGAWGEWHSSQGGNSYGYNSLPSVTEIIADSRRAQIKDSLVANVPNDIKISFRLPNDLVKWSNNNPANIKFGFINDCWMAGPDDMGTFSSNSERDFIKNLTTTNPFGGETCSDPGIKLRNSCIESMAEAKDYHLAYLNSGYSLDFINKWKSEGCFLQIAKQMGYRFSLISMKYPTEIFINKNLEIDFEVKNTGWSKLFKKRFFKFVFTETTTRETFSFNAGNTDDLNASMNSSLIYKMSTKVSNLIKPGIYSLSISLPDTSLLQKNENSLAENKFNAIRFANSDNVSLKQSWDPSTSVFQTGVVIKILNQ